MSVESLRLFHESAQPERPRDFEVGQIQGMTEMSPEAFDLPEDLQPAHIVKVDVYNPNIAYLNATNPGRYQQIRRQESMMDTFSRANFRNWRRRPQQEIAYQDQAAAPDPEQDGLSMNDSTAHGDTESRKKFFGAGGLLGDPALALWQKLIPQASALTPLVNPYNTDVIRHPQTGHVEPTTDTTREWMTACTDGQEIYHRSAIMVDEMGTYLGKYAATHPDRQMTVMSVAGGTALSTMQAVMRSGVDPAKVDLVLLEGNETSAAMALELAARIGYKGKITIKNTDVFSPAQMKQVRQELDEADANVVALDAVGIAEYSNEKLRTPAREKRYGQDYMLYNPKEFIKTCRSFLSEEGMAVIGQMRADRPNPYFTRGVVSWPTICMRSVKEFTKVLKGSGADLSLTKISLTPLDTYAMATLYGSEKAAHLAGLANVEYAPAEERMAGSALLRAVQAAGCIGSVASGSRTIQDS